MDKDQLSKTPGPPPIRKAPPPVPQQTQSFRSSPQPPVRSSNGSAGIQVDAGLINTVRNLLPKFPHRVTSTIPNTNATNEQIMRAIASLLPNCDVRLEEGSLIATDIDRVLVQGWQRWLDEQTWWDILYFRKLRLRAITTRFNVNRTGKSVTITADTQLGWTRFSGYLALFVLMFVGWAWLIKGALWNKFVLSPSLESATQAMLEKAVMNS